MTENKNGILTFIRESATTIFALGVLGASAWIINNQNSSNVKLAVISLQLDTVKENILLLKETVVSGDSQLHNEIDALKTRVYNLELKAK